MDYFSFFGMAIVIVGYIIVRMVWMAWKGEL